MTVWFLAWTLSILRRIRDKKDERWPPGWEPSCLQVTSHKIGQSVHALLIIIHTTGLKWALYCYNGVFLFCFVVAWVMQQVAVYNMSLRIYLRFMWSIWGSWNHINKYIQITFTFTTNKFEYILLEDTSTQRQNTCKVKKLKCSTGHSWEGF